MDDTAQIGELLTAPAPALPPDTAADLALRHFGVSGQLRALTSERDVNYHIATPEQGYVLKLAHPAEPRAVTEFQTAALLHLERAAPDLPVPRVIRSRDGGTGVALPDGRWLRLLTYLEGTPLHLSPRSPGQRRAMGWMAARLTQGLAGFSHPGADHDLLWDIRQAARLRPLLDMIAPDIRPVARAVQSRFDTEVAPALPGLRWQIVHNDLNPHNVLTAPEDPDRIAGVLDFGDMVRTPLVCDLAVAASYQIDAADPLGSLADVTAAYHATLPLLPSEAALVFDLTATRMLTTLAIASWRAARHPGNAAYILRNTISARTGLEAFAALDRPAAIARLMAVCPPGEGRP
jgi:hydroxylysine kinase